MTTDQRNHITINTHVSENWREKIVKNNPYCYESCLKGQMHFLLTEKKFPFNLFWFNWMKIAKLVQLKVKQLLLEKKYIAFGKKKYWPKVKIWLTDGDNYSLFIDFIY